MAALLQQMAVEQAVPDALRRRRSRSADRGQRLAQRCSRADETQLLYSIALHGRAELGLAPDEYSGLVMVLLRMLAFPAAGGSGAATPADAAAAPRAVAARRRRAAAARGGAGRRERTAARRRAAPPAMRTRRAPRAALQPRRAGASARAPRASRRRGWRRAASTVDARRSAR